MMNEKNEVIEINQNWMSNRQKKFANDSIFLDLLKCGDIFFEGNKKDIPIYAFDKGLKDDLCSKYDCNIKKIYHRLRAGIETELLIRHGMGTYIANPNYFLIQSKN